MGKLNFDNILTLAERESGVRGLASDGLRTRVAAMISWINDRGPFDSTQLREMQAQIVRLLANRLRVALDRKRYSAIADEVIERPVFIIGFPRSGTTLLHSLLTEDPAVLSLKSWHIYSPSPPPGAGPVVRERIAFAQRAVEAWMDFCPAQKSMHPYIDKGAMQLIEDEELAALDFRTVYPYHFYKVPVLDGMPTPTGDPVEGFHFHREVLQHLQWQTGKRRWICKGPSHQMHLAALLKVYPDALCVWAHRPLSETYASNVALRAAVFDTICGRPIDWSQQARAHAEAMKAAVDRLMESDLIDDPLVLHLSFRDIARDPLGAVRQVYEPQGLALDAGAERQMRGWLADPENASDRYGRYPYSYEAFGLDKDWIEDLFADYSKRFGLA